MLAAIALSACGEDDAVTGDAPSCMMRAEPHDEDGDGIYDACDNCPANANPAQLDTTEDAAHAFPDGVGDGCDPRPGVAGDTLRAFYSFASTEQAMAWTGSGWTIADDAMHANGDASFASTRALQGDGYLVRADVASLTANGPSALAITVDGNGETTGATCSLHDAMLIAAEAGGTPMTLPLANAIAPGEALTLIAWRTVSLSGTLRIPELTCRVIRGAVSRDLEVRLTDELLVGTHVIASRGALVDIASMSVYTSPGPKNP